MMTYHARVERVDRLTYIAMNVGFGEVVLEHPHPKYADRVECLTDTGVMIIKGIDGSIITAFVANVEKVVAIYREEGYHRVPTKMMNKVTKNVKHLKIQNVVRY